MTEIWLVIDPRGIAKSAHKSQLSAKHERDTLNTGLRDGPYQLAGRYWSVKSCMMKDA